MLTLQFVPYADIESLSSEERVNKLLDAVKKDSMVVLEGCLRPEEEALLMEQTMREVSSRFKGIEFSVIHPHPENEVLIQKIKNLLAHLLLGDRQGFTIIGPAKLVKEIHQNPDQMLFTLEQHVKRKTHKPKHSRSARR